MASYHYTESKYHTIIKVREGCITGVTYHQHLKQIHGWHQEPGKAWFSLPPRQLKYPSAAADSLSCSLERTLHLTKLKVDMTSPVEPPEAYLVKNLKDEHS
jgi:hypothetical protein